MEERFITEGVLRAARRLAKRERLPMVVVLLEGGHVSEAQVVDILSRRAKLPIIDPQRAALDEDIIREMPYDLAEKHRALPLSLERDPARKGGAARLRVALADPLDREAIGEIEALTGHQVDPVIGPAAALLSAIRFHYRGALSRSGSAPELSAQRPALLDKSPSVAMNHGGALNGDGDPGERTTLPNMAGDALKAIRRQAATTTHPGGERPGRTATTTPDGGRGARTTWEDEAPEGKPGDHITQPLQPEADDAPVEIRLRALINVLCETGILSERVYQEAVQRLLRGS